MARITVTLAADLVKSIDCQSKSRSTFVTQAIRRELDRRRCAELRQSLENPHGEIGALADPRLGDVAIYWPGQDVEAIVDMSLGRVIGWTPGRGWQEISEENTAPRPE
jgi:hypothetical protein